MIERKYDEEGNVAFIRAYDGMQWSTMGEDDVQRELLAMDKKLVELVEDYLESDDDDDMAEKANSITEYLLGNGIEPGFNDSYDRLEILWLKPGQIIRVFYDCDMEVIVMDDACFLMKT